ncbi:MAG: (Fe-S)-binding protein [Candidatus Heimdallarchaeota archaeon]
MCSYCGFCRESKSSCPIFQETRWESNTARGKLQLTKAVMDGKISKKDALPTLANAVLNCTLCGACEEVCQNQIPLVRTWEALRAVVEENWPASLKKFAEAIVQTKNIFSLDNEEERMLWDMDDLMDEDRINQPAPLAYFVGCVTSFSGRMGHIAGQMVEVFEAANLDFTILGGEEWCCGNPLQLLGLRDKAVPFVKHNMAALRKLGVKKVVTACSGCYKTLALEYPSLLANNSGITIYHHSQLLKELIDENLLSFSNPIEKKITFKDPCELGRLAGIYEAPRDVISSLPGAKLVELPLSRHEARCCGAGGVFKVIDPEMVAPLGDRMVQEIVESGADIVANGCPTCYDNIALAARRQSPKLRVVDIIELVHEALNL